MSEVGAGTGRKQLSSLGTTLCSNRRPSTPWNHQPTLMYYAFWRCGHREWSCWRGVTVHAVLGSRTWHTAHCLSWTRSCIPDGTIGAHQFTAKCAAKGGTGPRWSFATNTNTGIIFGVWIPRSWRCLVDHGRATNTKVQTSHFVTVIRDILNHESDEHDKLGEILLGSATFW